MNKLFRTLLVVLVFCLYYSNVVAATKTNSGNIAIKRPLPLFKPKNLLGSPKIRVAGGTRGKDNQDLHQSDAELYVLAPEQQGFTSYSQPVLYWYVSKPVKEIIEIAITDNDKQLVLLKTSVNGIAKAGIQIFNLADYKVYLKPGTKYQWSVAIVNNPKQRSSDIFASAGIMYFPVTDSIKIRLAAANDESRVSIFATEGIWYDELEAIQSMLKKMPENQTAGKWRQIFLEQAGLVFLD